MNIRCVVTGQSESGTSVIVRDSAVEPITLSLLPGFEFHRLWGSDTRPKLPSDGAATLPVRYFPPQQGFRFGFFTIPPNTERVAKQIDILAALMELQQKLPGMAEVLEPGNPGMHTTDTVDFDRGVGSVLPRARWRRRGSAHGGRLRNSEWDTARVAKSIGRELRYRGSPDRRRPRGCVRAIAP